MNTTTITQTPLEFFVKMAAMNLEKSKQEMTELFFSSRPTSPVLTDEEIQAEVSAVRYRR